jgi:dolichyl-diphosphooligosaccharide--protein glycosyltransferase
VRALAPALAAGLLALAVRALPAPTVLETGGVVALEPDAYYHLRRVVWTATHFPRFLWRDSYLNYPHGGEAIWTPALDWSLAALGRWLVGPGDLAGLERLAVWLPPVLGALTVAALVLLLRRRHAPIALGAGLLLAILPAHFWYSQLGFLDHHAAVAWLTTFALFAGAWLFEWDGREGARAGVPRALALGIALGAALLVWPGCLLHVAIAEAALLARLIWLPSRTGAAFAALAALSQATAAALVAPLALGRTWQVWGGASPVVLSGFQPVWLAVWTAGFAVYAIVAHSRELPSRLVRALCAAGAPLAALAGGMLLVPGLRESLSDAPLWLARAEPFQSQVEESSPLYWSARGFDARLAAQLLSHLGHLTPLGLAALWAAARGRPGAAPERWLAWWVGALYLAALVQHRFVDSFSVGYAVLLAWCLRAGSVRLRTRFAGWRRPLLEALAGLALLVALAPALGFYRGYVVNAVRGAHGEAPVPQGSLRVQRVLVDLGRWLRDHSPETSGWLDPAARPEYSVLVPWTHGHVLRYEARRPVPVDNFGDDVAPENFELVAAYFAAGDEERGLALARRLGARYVLVDATSAASRAPEDLGRLGTRLFLPEVVAGARWRSPWPGAARQPPLRHHRLVYESDPRPDLPAESPPLFLLYEVVPGARVEGRAPAGAEVRAHLRLRTRRGRVIEWEDAARADAEGRYAFVVPYSTGAPGAAVAPGPCLELASGDERATLVVPEAAVLAGAAVPAPPLAAGGPGAKACAPGWPLERAPLSPGSRRSRSRRPKRSSRRGGAPTCHTAR